MPIDQLPDPIMWAKLMETIINLPKTALETIKSWKDFRSEDERAIVEGTIQSLEDAQLLFKESQAKVAIDLGGEICRYHWPYTPCKLIAPMEWRCVECGRNPFETPEDYVGKPIT